MDSSSFSIPVSSLQHMLYCPRQCALIHMEHVWTENQYTVEGKILHERADSGEKSSRRGVKICRSIHIYSDSLGIHGVADIVEYYKESLGWLPRPVEYKRGRPKKTREDEVQLCAQALCLEEMHGVSIHSGDLYYGTTKRRVEVPFDEVLRELTKATIFEVRDMLLSGETPVAEYSKRCVKCSLADVCMPEAQRLKRGVSAWNERMFENTLSNID